MVLYFNTADSPFRLDPTLSGHLSSDQSNPIAPGQASTLDTTPLLDVVSFGDGYAQRALSGVRATRRRFSLTFARRSIPITTALRKFFLGSGANTLYDRTVAEPFYLRLDEPFADPDGPIPKWVVANQNFNVKPDSGNSYTTTVEIEEWFGA